MTTRTAPHTCGPPGGGPAPGRRFVSQRSLPLVYVPYGIQKTDSSCTFYSHGFLRAAGQLLQDPGARAEVVAMARRVARGEAGAAEELQSFFRDRLKPLLPEYYTAEGVARSEAETMPYHLQQRWELDGALLDGLASEPASRQGP